MTERKIADELEDWVKSLTESESGDLISALAISINFCINFHLISKFCSNPFGISTTVDNEHAQN